MAAPLDCKIARTPQEKMICQNKELLAADANLSKAYDNASKKYKLVIADIHQTNFYRHHQDWLKERNACLNLKCLHKAYRKELLELKEYNKMRVSPLNAEMHDAEIDGEAYFVAWSAMEKVPEGAKVISACNENEIKEIVSLMKNNKNILFVDKRVSDSDFSYRYKDGELSFCYDTCRDLEIYKGDFSNDGTTKFAFANGFEELRMYKRVGNHLEEDLSFGAAIKAHVHWPDHDGYGIQYFRPNFAYIKNGKTYVRFHPNIYNGTNYDKSILRACTYLWDGQSNKFSLTGPNFRVAYNGKLIPADDCYSEKIPVDS